MRKFLLCVVLSLTWGQMQAQIDTDTTLLVSFLQNFPTFQGGEKEFQRFFNKNFREPKIISKTGLRGKVWIKFIISEIGEITDIQILRGLQNCPECNEEALRLIKMMPKWIPASRNGKPVSWNYTLHIPFGL